MCAEGVQDIDDNLAIFAQSVLGRDDSPKPRTWLMLQLQSRSRHVSFLLAPTLSPSPQLGLFVTAQDPALEQTLCSSPMLDPSPPWVACFVVVHFPVVAVAPHMQSMNDIEGYKAARHRDGHKEEDDQCDNPGTEGHCWHVDSGCEVEKVSAVEMEVAMSPIPSRPFKQKTVWSLARFEAEVLV